MRESIERVVAYGSGLFVVALVFGARLSASGAINTPEIDGGTLTTGLGVLAAGALILRARFRSK